MEIGAVGEHGEHVHQTKRQEQDDVIVLSLIMVAADVLGGATQILLPLRVVVNNSLYCQAKVQLMFSPSPKFKVQVQTGLERH